MRFEERDLSPRGPRPRLGNRVLDGYVQGQSDCWVVVAREERDLEDWYRSEQQAVEVVPLRMCTAVLDDGALILDDSESVADDLLDEAELR